MNLIRAGNPWQKIASEYFTFNSMQSDAPNFGKDPQPSENMDGLENTLVPTQVMGPEELGTGLPGNQLNNSVLELNKFKESEPKRVEVSVELSNRYIKLREDILQSKRELSGLRREFSEKQEQQNALLAECKEDDVNRARLDGLIGSLNQVVGLIQDEEKPDSLANHQKVELVKRALLPCLQWNTHLAALVNCLEAQQHEVMKPTSMLRPYSSRTRGVSPAGAWIP